MPKRVDDNQPEIVQAIRAGGWTCQHIHEIGKGCPDIIAGGNGLTIVGDFDFDEVVFALLHVQGIRHIYDGANLLFEIKDGEKSASQRRLTPDEKNWHRLWRGQVSIIKSSDEALKAIGKVSDEST